MSEGEVVAILAAFVAGSLLKSVSGIGLPLITIPVISFISGIEDAVALTALPNLVQNAALVGSERRHWHQTRDLPVLGIAGFGGAVAGTLLLVSLPEEPLIAALIAVVLLYVILYLAAPSFSVGPRWSRWLAPLVGGSAGVMQGAVGISGPIVSSWIHAYRLSPGANVLSVATLFLFAGAAQLPTLAISGEMAGLWTLTLVACVPALATVPLGARVRGRLSAEFFEKLVVAVIAASVVGLAIRTFG